MPLTEERVAKFAGFDPETFRNILDPARMADAVLVRELAADWLALRQQVKDAEVERDQWKRTAHEALEPLPICKCGDHFDNESLCWGCVADECNATESALRQQNAALRAMVEECIGHGFSAQPFLDFAGWQRGWHSFRARLAALGGP
jgi:hypothetical protein